MKIYFSNILITLSCLLLLGCSASRITNTWVSPNIKPQDYKRILVLALIHSKDKPVQEQMERHLTGDLKTLGYDAVSSIKEYGANFFDSLDEKTVISKLHNDKINAILTIVLLNKSMESYDALWSIFFSPYAIYDSDFWDYYNATHYIYDPRYYQEHTTWYWQSNLYDATSKALLYSVQTQSFDPSSTEKLSHRYGRKIIQDMIKNKVLQSN